MLLAALVIAAVTLVKAQSHVATFPSDFVVVDSTGKPIGPVIGTMQGSGITIVAFPFQGKWLLVDVQRSTFQTGALFFMSSDCTGQPFQDPSSSPFLATAVSGPSNKLYFESGPAQGITVQSFLDASTGSCSATSFTINAVPMGPAINLNVFTPPFSVVREAKAL